MTTGHWVRAHPAAGVESFHPDQMDRNRTSERIDLASPFDVVDRARGEYDAPVTNVISQAGRGARAVTILVGFSTSRQGDAPINLAIRMPSSGESTSPRPWPSAPPCSDPVEDEYLTVVRDQYPHITGTGDRAGWAGTDIPS